jgi:hypothetical protein
MRQTDKRRLHSARVAAVLLAVFQSGAFPATAAQPRWTKIDAVAGFSGWRKELQRWADTEGRQPVNHFCVVAETFRPPRGLADPKPPPEEVVARVYWSEAHRLRSLDPSSTAVDASSLLPGNDLDLDRDVRATQAEVGASTYLVTRSWVDSVIRHCRRYGAEIIIEKGR